jgi:DUF4097 and DUF4098 domain-containing protein YvlB
MLLSLLPMAALAQSTACEGGSCAVAERIYRDGRYFVQEITGSLPAMPKLSVATDAGWIRISGDSAGKRITYKANKRVRASSEEEAKRYFEGSRFKAYTSGSAAVLRGESDQSRRNTMIEIEVETPRNIQYATASSHGGSVEITGIDGKANAESHGGSIHLTDIGGTAAGSTMGGSIEADRIGGDLRLETAGGSITVGTVKGHIVAETAGGSISVVNATGDVSLETAGGSIGVQKCGGDLKAATAGGSIEAGDVGKGATLETAGGSIRLTSANDIVKAVTNGGGIRLMRLTKGVYAETRAGGIEAEFIAKKGDFTDSKLATDVGDIIVTIPSDLAVTLRATIEMANGHRIYAPEIPELQISSDGGDYGPRTIYGYAQINGGGPLLKLDTSNGNIKIRRVRR